MTIIAREKQNGAEVRAICYKLSAVQKEAAQPSINPIYEEVIRSVQKG